MQSLIDIRANIDDDQAWETLRLEQFQTQRVNLNPGTMGFMPMTVRKTLHSQINGDPFPLAQYNQGRAALAELRNLLANLWGFTTITLPSAAARRKFAAN